MSLVFTGSTSIKLHNSPLGRWLFQSTALMNNPQILEDCNHRHIPNTSALVDWLMHFHVSSFSGIQAQGLTTPLDSHMGPILMKWEKQEMEPNFRLNMTCGNTVHIPWARAGHRQSLTGVLGRIFWQGPSRLQYFSGQKGK